MKTKTNKKTKTVRGFEAFVYEHMPWVGLFMALGAIARAAEFYSGYIFRVNELLGPTGSVWYGVVTGFALSFGGLAVLGKGGKQADYFTALVRSTEENKRIPTKVRMRDAKRYRRLARQSRFFSLFAVIAEICAAFFYTAGWGKEGGGLLVTQGFIACSLVLFTYFFFVVNTTLPLYTTIAPAISKVRAPSANVRRDSGKGARGYVNDPEYQRRTREFDRTNPTASIASLARHLDVSQGTAQALRTLVRRESDVSASLEVLDTTNLQEVSENHKN